MGNEDGETKYAMVNRYWFKPKVFGYGATPTTWEGWALTGGYCVVIAVGTLVAILLIEGRAEATLLHWLAWGVWGIVLAIATAILVIVSRRRTEGEWRWRWGRRASRPFRSS